MKLSKDNVELGLASLSTLIDIFSKFEDEFDEIAHKGFFLVYELYSHYKLIYTANMERLESALTPAINKALAPLNEKINQCIDLVNSDEKNLKISNNLKFNQEGKPIIRKEHIMQNNTIGLGLNLLSSLTNIAKTDTNIDHNYINTFSKVIDFFYKTYISTLKSMETAESTKIFEEIQDILKYNIEIIEAISTDKSKRIITSLKATRNKIMKEYIKILKRGENA